MTKDNSPIKRILAVIFVLFMFVMFIQSGSLLQMNNIFNYLAHDNYSGESQTIDKLESDFGQKVWGKRRLINLNGSMARILGMQGYYSSMGMYITKDNYIVSASGYTTTDYEYEELIDFRDFLTANNINLLYVNEPTKYLDDSIFSNEFGVETYSNRNTDCFIERIRKAGINAIDLREQIIEDNLSISDLFYKTDHHWTTEAGLWATKIISQGLNEYCGYNIDTELFDIDNYQKVEWKECWLGEQGRKVAETYVGLDDYTELKPLFATDYTFKNKDGSLTNGDFDYFIDEEVYNTENDVYENPSWHYSYKRINCINNNVKTGKVLLLCDSYDYVTQPFLSLGIREVDSLILRDYDDSFNLRNYIIENGYDTVVVAYVQFMVGAHDNPSSANYRMFTFD